MYSISYAYLKTKSSITLFWEGGAGFEITLLDLNQNKRFIDDFFLKWGLFVDMCII